MTDHVPLGIPSNSMRGAVNKTSELLPCPFCGCGGLLNVIAFGIEAVDETPEDRPHSVVCDECGGAGPEVAPRANAVSQWNTRATPAPEPQPEVAAEPVAWASCPGCNGTGDQGGNPSYGACDDCGGSGKIGTIATPPVVEEAVKAEVRVRELEWSSTLEDPSLAGGAYSEAATAFGVYMAWGSGMWRGPFSGAQQHSGDLTSAKAAAQADFAQRALSALSSGDAS